MLRIRAGEVPEELTEEQLIEPMLKANFGHYLARAICLTNNGNAFRWLIKKGFDGFESYEMMDDTRWKAVESGRDEIVKAIEEEVDIGDLAIGGSPIFVSTLKTPTKSKKKKFVCPNWDEIKIIKNSY